MLSFPDTIIGSMKRTHRKWSAFVAHPAVGNSWTKQSEILNWEKKVTATPKRGKKPHPLPVYKECSSLQNFLITFLPQGMIDYWLTNHLLLLFLQHVHSGSCFSDCCCITNAVSKIFHFNLLPEEEDHSWMGFKICGNLLYWQELQGTPCRDSFAVVGHHIALVLQREGGSFHHRDSKEDTNNVELHTIFFLKIQF